MFGQVVGLDFHHLGQHSHLERQRIGQAGGGEQADFAIAGKRVGSQRDAQGDAFDKLRIELVLGIAPLHHRLAEGRDLVVGNAGLARDLGEQVLLAEVAKRALFGLHFLALRLQQVADRLFARPGQRLENLEHLRTRAGTGDHGRGGTG